MIPKTFDDIDKSDIDALIENSVNESKTLEYKRKLPEALDKGKKEFLADVSSFANASGGDIIFGIEEKPGEDDGNTGVAGKVLPIQSETADQAKQRLEQIILYGIDPRLKVQIKDIMVNEKKQEFVILLRIPQGIASPYMVTHKNASRFYSRNSSGKYQLDVHQIRSAFLATSHRQIASNASEKNVSAES